MTTDTGLVPGQAGTIARQEFGAQQLTASGETAAASIAAMMQAAVQARYIVARQRPRDWDDVEARIMRRIESPGFAEVAWFKKPIGQGVEGLSVRFTDMASQCMGNILEEAPAIYEDAHKRLIRVSVTDLETNLTKFKDVVLEKTVERRSLNDGRLALSVRKNSRGEPTYTVPATEDELLAKEGALCSKIRRNLILQILPGNIQDKAKARILEIRDGATPKDPESGKRKVLEAFALLNVTPSDLKLYLGHEVATCSPAELQNLRDLYSMIASGEATWADVMADKKAATAAGSESTGDEPTSTKPGLEGVKERLKAAATGASAPAQAAVPTPVSSDVEPEVKPEKKK
jgi:hypothetical protein